MKFILLLCILTTVFSLNTSQSSKPKLFVDCATEPGKNIPDYPLLKYEEVPISARVNDNHFIISAIIPDWETICK